MPERITKRLHISGLTPTLTPTDLSSRLSHFGTVKSLDGFGLLDAVGQPRKFAFVEMEIEEGNLKRCLTTLSGTTYKGAKLRIAEAKPDYATRLAKEREQSTNDTPPTKKPRLHLNRKFTATYHPDMTLITRENAAGRAGWKVMPSGRVVRSMRMRPGKPLVPIPSSRLVSTGMAGRGKGKDGGKEKERRRRVREPDTRARIRTIDVTRWDAGTGAGAAYLRGEFLSGGVRVGVGSKDVQREVVQRLEEEEEEEEDLVEDTGESDTFEAEAEARKFSTSTTNPTSNMNVNPTTTTTTNTNPDPTGLFSERTQTLSFIDSLFASTASKKRKAGAAADVLPVDWDSDVDIDEAEAGVVLARDAKEVKNGVEGGEEGYEVIPRTWERDEREGEGGAEDGMDVDVDVDGGDGDEVSEGEGEEPGSAPEHGGDPQVKNTLKDLFKPREEEASFSLLNHLDLELDDELDLTAFGLGLSSTQSETQPPIDPASTLTVSSIPPQTSQSPASRPTTHLDPKKPLFFPRSLDGGSTLADSPFYKVSTAEEARKRWEESKGELTRGWKKRWREAGKVGRRRGAGAGAGTWRDGDGGE